MEKGVEERMPASSLTPNAGSLIRIEGTCSVCVIGHFSGVRLCAILWTVARQAPLSMGFSRQEYWSGFVVPSSREFSQSKSVTYSALTGGFFTTSASWEAHSGDIGT